MDSLAIFDRMMRNAEAHRREMMGRHPCAEMIRIAFNRLCDDVEDFRNAEENQDTFGEEFWYSYDDNNREEMGFWTINYLMDGEISFLNFDAHCDIEGYDMSWDTYDYYNFT
jgi:hypothetical protein